MRLHKIERGRYVIYFGKDYGDAAFRVETSHSYNFGLGFNLKAEETDRQLSIYVWRLFSVWFTLENKRFKYRGDPLETGIVWDSKQHVIKIELLSQQGMDSSKPAVIYKYWNYRDWLFGRPIYSESRHRDVLLGQRRQEYFMKMPEGKYKMGMDFYTSYWHRPRSPFVKTIERVEITPEKPVPTPGKGENSWDLDEDATYSSTMPVRGRSPEELVADFKQSTMERRERYGGKNWLPENATTEVTT